MILKTRIDEITTNVVKETWFAGLDRDHLQHMGTLVFKIGEYQIIKAALLCGIEVVNENYKHITLVRDNDKFGMFCQSKPSESEIDQARREK